MTTRPTVSELLTELVREAADAAGYGDAGVSLEPAVVVQDTRHGDYQSNHAFRLAKAARANPRAVAEQIKAALPAHPAVRLVEVAGPGFLNFHLDDAWIGGELATRATSDRFGVGLPSAGQRLVIDYSAPNIAKRMHVGHLRSTIIGNALDRMYRFVGYDVVSDNHIGDWGTQFGKLIVGWHGWRNEAAYREDPIGELQRIYKLFGEKAAEDPSLEDRARAETVKLQEGDPENRALWEAFITESMKEFDAVYERLGVRFDVTLGESYYRDELAPLVEELLATGVAQVSEGAVVVPFEPADGKDLANAPLLIRKRDGASLYGTTDLATVRHRVRTWDPQVIVYLSDVRQQLHFKQVFAASRKMGVERDFRHVWFGMLRFADGSIAATRSGGQMINLIDVLDEAVARARAVVDERSADLPASDRARIAEAVGTAAVRYADLSQNPQSDLLFEWDKMLSLQGNTAPYLMYAHARCCSILRKAGEERAGVVLPTHPSERALALTLLRLPEVIEQAVRTSRPNLLADHLYETAGVFAGFYTECPVLSDPDPAVRASRLGLVAATARVLKIGLGLMGIEALERM